MEKNLKINIRIYTVLSPFKLKSCLNMHNTYILNVTKVFLCDKVIQEKM